MIGHPILISVAAVDLLTLAALAASLFAVFPVSVRWEPGSADRAQLMLERRAEAGTMAAYATTICLLLSTVLLVAAFSLVLPRTIPGAMCGTGVLQAAGDAGARALGFRLLALLCLSAWQLLEGLNSSRPDAPLTETGVRVLLASSPVVLLGIAETQRALQAASVPALRGTTGQGLFWCFRRQSPLSQRRFAGPLRCAQRLSGCLRCLFFSGCRRPPSVWCTSFHRPSSVCWPIRVRGVCFSRNTVWWDLFCSAPWPLRCGKGCWPR